ASLVSRSDPALCEETRRLATAVAFVTHDRPRARTCPTAPDKGRFFEGESDLHLSSLSALELVVLGEDVLMRRTLVWHVRMMMLAQDVRRPFKGVVTNPPTSPRMAVHFAHTGIDTHTNGANEGGLSKIGAETGPEVVVDVWSAMKGPGVEREPVAEGTERGDQERDHHDHCEQASQPDGSVPRAVRGERRHRGHRGAVCGRDRVAGVRR